MADTPKRAPKPAPTKKKTATKATALRDKQARFVVEYCVDCNATRAAIRAGYSADTARVIGPENLSKPAIRAAIDARLRALAMPADEALKQLSDIASTRLNDFLVVRQVQGFALVRRRLGDLIAEVEGQIDFVRGFIDGEGLTTEEAKAPYLKRIDELREKLLDYHLQAEQYGADAELLVPGPPVIREIAELDMVALARAQDVGRIKSYALTKEGVKVEAYHADAALRDVLRIAGRYNEKGLDPTEPITIIVRRERNRPNPA